METTKLTFYSLKLTSKEVDELIKGQPSPTNFLLSFELLGKDNSGFGAAIYIQNYDHSIGKIKFNLAKLDNSEYVIAGPLFLSTNIVPVSNIQNMLNNNPDKYLTLRPYIDKDNFIRYDIDTPSDNDFSIKIPSEGETIHALSFTASSGSNSISTNPSPPLN